MGPVTEDGGIIWEAPGPGLWSHDPVHYPAPATGFVQRTEMPGAAEGFRLGYARYGHPTYANKRAVVHGWPYGQRVPIGESLFAEREEAARRAIEERLWQVDGGRWFNVERPRMHEECLALQAVDPAALTADDLASHLFDALELQRRAQVYHFSHVAMLFVVGEWLLAAEEWGIDAHDAHSLLAGASPATAAAARALDKVAGTLHAAGAADIESVEHIRAASPQAAEALDDYLTNYGWRAISSFDHDALTLVELPDVLLGSVRHAMASPFVERKPDIESVRSRVPRTEREAFDTLLGEARYVYGLRDDDVGPCMWGRGLTRRALLEIAARLISRGALHERDHVLEAGANELAGLLTGHSVPDAAELANRAEQRQRQAALSPPRTIGAPAPQASEDLPPTVARVARGMAAYMGRPPETVESGAMILGTGVGTRPYRGRARVAGRVEDAMARLDPGDVLVTTITTPAFNSVLSIVGALVVEYGGPTSHSGIMARELGIPAVLDARGCMTRIPDGAEVEVDPTKGVVNLTA